MKMCQRLWLFINNILSRIISVCLGNSDCFLVYCFSVAYLLTSMFINNARSFLCIIHFLQLLLIIRSVQCVISVFIGMPNYKNRLKFNTETVSSRPATSKIYFSNIAVCEAAAWCFLSGLQHFISLCWPELVLRVGFIFRKPKVSINYIALSDLYILRSTAALFH